VRLEWRNVTLGDGPAISTSLTESETLELQRLAIGRKLALEIGSAYGYSTIALAQTGIELMAVDPHRAHNSLQTIQQNLRAYGVDQQVTIIVGWSQEILSTLPKRHFDLIFVDGDHSPEGVRHDIRWARELVTDGGVIVCHDYGEQTCPGVQIALDEWRTPDYLVDTLAVYKEA
jgi:predicted O-methyltransferase YrrM